MSERVFALLGAGEFQDWHDDVDRRLLDRADGDGRVLILPTASAREGEEVFDRWGAMGLAHYARLGVDVEVLPLKSRDEASRPDLIERLAGASVVFFSGGNPAYLARVLRDTPFCTAMYERMAEGMAFAGCSAGVACLSERTFDSDTDDFEHVFKPGLGYVRRTLFGPHWDTVDAWIPGATEMIVGTVQPNETFVGLDENTAMVGDGLKWQVHGAGRIHIQRDEAWERHGSGVSFDLAFELSA